MCQKLMSKALKGQRLTVKLIHEIPVAIDPRKLLMSDIPQNVSEEFLTLFIESRLRLQAGDFTLTVRPPKALLTLMHDHSEKGRALSVVMYLSALQLCSILIKSFCSAMK